MKVAIYSRKSKYTGKGDSIGNQIQMCKDYIESHYKNSNIEYVIYEDEGFSGGNTNRPNFQKLLTDIKTEKFNILICYRLDRISRNVSDFSTTLDELQGYEVDFISIKEQFDTTTPMGRAMIYIASVFAQLERETIAERVKDNMIEMAKGGKWSGGRTPLGFDSETSSYIDEDGHERKIVRLVNNEEELKLVKLIYDTYLKEGSLHKSEVYFTRNNIKSNSGILLEKTSLKLILTNPVYAISSQDLKSWLENDGWNVYGEPDGVHSYLSYNKTKQVTRNGKVTKIINDKDEWIAAISNCKGYIPSDTWIRVQEQLKNNKGSFPTRGKTHNAILVGKLNCAICDNYMHVIHGRISKKTGIKQFYYGCSMKRRSHGEFCKNENVKVDLIEEIVLDQLENLSKRNEQFIESLKRKNEKVKKSTDIKIKKVKLEKQILEKQNLLNNLVDKLASTPDIEDILLDRIKCTRKEILDLQRDCDYLDKEIENSLNKKIDLDLISQILNKCANIRNLDIQEQKLIINVLIDKIYWNGNTENIRIDFIGAEVSKKNRTSSS